jgi:hypothetical protein
MSLAKEINIELDNILKIKAEVKRINAEITNEDSFTNINTGEKVGKKKVLETAHDMQIKSQENLMKLIGDGSNIKDIFTNKFYVNDYMQDKICARVEFAKKIKTKYNNPNNIQNN